MAIEPMAVAVYAGAFDSQPLVFAYLLDAMPGLDLDHVEVICGVDPVPRLAHALSSDDTSRVEDALGTRTTVVLVFAAAAGGGPLPEGDERLQRIGTYVGLRHRPNL